VLPRLAFGGDGAAHEPTTEHPRCAPTTAAHGGLHVDAMEEAGDRNATATSTGVAGHWSRFIILQSLLVLHGPPRAQETCIARHQRLRGRADTVSRSNAQNRSIGVGSVVRWRQRLLASAEKGR
jgi:hypothetical protein